jgi:hypothetical protein
LIFGVAPTGPLFWLGIPVMALRGVSGAAIQALLTQSALLIAARTLAIPRLADFNSRPQPILPLAEHLQTAPVNQVACGRSN